MEMFFCRKILSFMLLFFIIINFFSLSFSNKETQLVKFGVLEQFFSTTKFSNDIVGKLFASKMKNKQTNQKSTKTDTTKFNDSLLPALLFVIPSTSNTFFNMFNANIYVLNSCVFNFNYSLKFLFLEFIFLILLTKILFSVLPRSISINYNKKYIENACIV